LFHMMREYHIRRPRSISPSLSPGAYANLFSGSMSRLVHQSRDSFERESGWLAQPAVIPVMFAFDRQPLLVIEWMLRGDAIGRDVEMSIRKRRTIMRALLVILPAALLFAIAGPAGAQTGEWESLNNRAATYFKSGKYDSAMVLARKALELAEEAGQENDPDLATSLNSLAEVHKVQGQYAQAEPLYTRALEIRSDLLGPDHPGVAEILNNLGELHIAQGQYAEAESLCTRALEIREKALGPDHPDVAETLNNLAELYDYQGEYAEAEKL
jgi:tetratricopeptide (TPR) repeat protein